MAQVSLNSKEDVQITEHDILFECASCRKSLVIDKVAEGLVVECPQCQSQVIVPPPESAPGSAKMPELTTPPPSASPSPTPPPAASAAIGLAQRLASLSHQLRELQTQRTEIATHVAARLNEINRQMVLLSRLEASHQKVLADLNAVQAQLKATETQSAS